MTYGALNLSWGFRCLAHDFLALDGSDKKPENLGASNLLRSVQLLAMPELTFADRGFG
jgi:hypothetical protein